MLNGYISLYRKIRNHWICKNPKYFHAWALMLMEVNYTSRKVVIGSRLFTAERGESLHSHAEWAKIFGNGWTRSAVQRFFKLLEEDNMIVQKNERKTSRVSIVNYDSYQEPRAANEQQMSSDCTASESQVSTNNNINNINKNNNINNPNSVSADEPDGSAEELFPENPTEDQRPPSTTKDPQADAIWWTQDKFNIFIPTDEHRGRTLALWQAVLDQYGVERCNHAYEQLQKTEIKKWYYPNDLDVFLKKDTTNSTPDFVVIDGKRFEIDEEPEMPPHIAKKYGVV